MCLTQLSHLVAIMMLGAVGRHGRRIVQSRGHGYSLLLLADEGHRVFELSAASDLVVVLTLRSRLRSDPVLRGSVVLVLRRKRGRVSARRIL